MRGRTALFSCDVGPGLGVGHLMRCVALSEELRRRGASVVFSADVDAVPFAREQLGRREIPWVPATGGARDLVELTRNTRADLHVIDSYQRPRDHYAALRSSPALCLALVDGDTGGREADIYLDQNLGAEHLQVWTAPGSTRLAGLDFALLRDDVVRRRPEAPRTELVSSGAPPRILAVFGGTDPFGAAPAVVAAMVASAQPFDATVVVAQERYRRQIACLELREGQRVTMIEPSADLAALVIAADAVISASGTSTWELLALGAAVGLVCVADNQASGYDQVTRQGAALPLGRLREGQVEGAEGSGLSRLLADSALREKLRRVGWALVDGRGRERVADTVTALIAG